MRLPSRSSGKGDNWGVSTPDIEKIIALEPDLILATSMHAKEVIPALEEKGLTVFALNPENLDEILESIQTVGKITGKEEEASELVTQLGNRIKAVTDKTEKLEEKPKVFHITWHDPLWSVGSETFIHDLIEKAGGENVFQDITGYKVVDLEEVIARNPEVIIGPTKHGTSEPIKWVKEEEPRLGSTDALKNDSLYTIKGDIVSRPGPRIVDALEWFAYFIHPKIFEAPKAEKSAYSLVGS